MAEPEPIDWRAAFALLANPGTRAVFAEIAGGEERSGASRERALAQLVAAGLLEAVDGGFAVAEGRLRATLKQSAPGPVRGVERFLSRDGRIVDYPSRRSDRRELLELVVLRSVGPDEDLSEPHLNERLARVSDDVATLRRYLVDAGLLTRSPDGRSYRIAPTDPPGTAQPALPPDSSRSSGGVKSSGLIPRTSA